MTSSIASLKFTQHIGTGSSSVALLSAGVPVAQLTSYSVAKAACNADALHTGGILRTGQDEISPPTWIFKVMVCMQLN